MFKIGELSQLTRVSVRMLRYYDQAGLLKPALVDPVSGYRLYSTEQIAIVQKICLLRDMDFKLSEMAPLLDSWHDAELEWALTKKRAEILAAIRQEQLRVAKIDRAIRDIAQEQMAVHSNVLLKAIPSYTVLSLRAVLPTYEDEGRLWEQLYAAVAFMRIELAAGTNNLAIFYDDSAASGVDVEVAVVVKKSGQALPPLVYRQTEAVEQMACIMVYGSYDHIGPAYQAFARWLEAHQQYEMAGPCRQICHLGLYNEPDPDKYLTEVQTPVRLRAAF